MNKTRAEIIKMETSEAFNIRARDLVGIFKSMDEWAKQQAKAFDRWKVEEGWEWSSSKWFKSKEVFWHQVPVGEYLAPDQLWDKFIEHQKQQNH